RSPGVLNDVPRMRVVGPCAERERLAWQHRLAESRAQLPDPARMALAQLVEQQPFGDAEGAHDAQERPPASGLPCECRVGMQRVAIAGEPVEQRLVRTNRRGQLEIGLARRALPPGAR